MRIVVVGGGFYGCSIAADAARKGASVTLLEARPGLMRASSWFNQARVHGGYHYPRALTTAARSRASYADFVRRYRDCVKDDFLCVYAVARGGLTNARKFRRVMGLIGAPLQEAPGHVRRMLDPGLIEAVWVAEESSFDTDKLRARMEDELDLAGVDVHLGEPVTRVEEHPDGAVVQTVAGSYRADCVFVCTYGESNAALPADVRFGELRCEPCEMALVDLPSELRDIGFTVMDGPFFSLFPFPSVGLHTLSHVRYTPHGAHSSFEAAAAAVKSGLPSRANRMIRDSARYLPALADAVHVESLWGVKVVPARRDNDDARPIVLRKSGGGRVVSMLGSKIDNIGDALSVAGASVGERV
ncbi:FAD-dependent oxidoreductase [Motilibacter deserti]|uniref:FAD-binding oxidoreductase n=1 Tax=Motilibacter deserti TaxID=2714956 RepID=A0ABX0H112_9ACTN|nr:FAD-binding oxidoreductase [Motilibacter deserti]